MSEATPNTATVPYWSIERASGFFEGDGSICVTGSKLKHRDPKIAKLKTYRVMIRFTQSRTDLLTDIRNEAFPELTKPHETSPKATAAGGYPKAYTAGFGGAASVRFLMTMIPNLRYRKRQALLVFDLLNSWGQFSRREDKMSDREKFLAEVIPLLNKPRRVDPRISRLETKYDILLTDVEAEAETTFNVARHNAAFNAGQADA